MILSQLFEVRRNVVDPRLHPKETFYYYNMPAFDENGQPELVRGSQIDSAKFIVDPGTVLISKLNPRIKRVWHVRNDGLFRSICSTEFLNVVPRKPATTDFLFQLLRSEGVYRLLERNAEGTTNSHVRFKPGFLGQIQLDEIAEEGSWSSIASILNTLDFQLEQTEALTAKYQQIKAGLMHDLFTRGLTSDGHLRPTRTQAPHLYKESSLGWIPREWEVKPLGVLAEIVSGVTLGSKSEISDGVGVPYLRVANVQDGYFDLKEVKTIHVSRLQFEKLQLKFGDVLMNEGGDFDKLGRGSVWQEEIKPCIHQNHVFRVRPRDGELRSYFLAFWSQSGMGKKYFVMSSKQSTNLASINSTQLNRFPVALPSSVEQERIEVRIMALNGHIDSLGHELAKLRQQKHGLMHDLLTGRVRVKVDESASI